jgi:AraC-like DNA-binding protein
VSTTADELPCLAVYAPPPRERARTLVRAAFSRRRARLIFTRSAAELAQAFRADLIDAVLLDLGGSAADDTWKAAELARDFPTAAFFAVMPLRAADGRILARCAELAFADVLIDGVDDGVTRELITPHCFRVRFAAALRDPPAALGLTSPLQQKTWQCIVGHAGLPVRTDTVAGVVGVTREHLSRAFAADLAPNLKRVIDLVRLIAAAELAKNPGYDIRDVALVLRFASASHLSSTAQRVVGMRPSSLARLRTVDLFERFAMGRGKSRG